MDLTLALNYTVHRPLTQPGDLTPQSGDLTSALRPTPSQGALHWPFHPARSPYTQSGCLTLSRPPQSEDRLHTQTEGLTLALTPRQRALHWPLHPDRGPYTGPYTQTEGLRLALTSSQEPLHPDRGPYTGPYIQPEALTPQSGGLTLALTPRQRALHWPLHPDRGPYTGPYIQPETLTPQSGGRPYTGPSTQFTVTRSQSDR